MKKKVYIKPEVLCIELDYSISLQMQSQPIDPPPRDPVVTGSKTNTPFASPFENNKPFN